MAPEMLLGESYNYKCDVYRCVNRIIKAFKVIKAFEVIKVV